MSSSPTTAAVVLPPGSKDSLPSIRFPVGPGRSPSRPLFLRAPASLTQREGHSWHSMTPSVTFLFLHVSDESRGSALASRQACSVTRGARLSHR